METNISQDADATPARRTAKKWPFARMNPGDSFAFAAEHRQSVASAASQYKKRHGVLFTIRRQKDGSYLIWRLEDDGTSNKVRPRATRSDRKYPFADMAVGDSFIVRPGDARLVESAARVARHRLGPEYKFIVRTDVPGSEVRCHRIEPMQPVTQAPIHRDYAAMAIGDQFLMTETENVYINDEIKAAMKANKGMRWKIVRALGAGGWACMRVK